MMMNTLNRYYNISKKSVCWVTLGVVLTTAVAFALAIFSPSSQPVWTSPSFVLQNTNLELGASKAYRPWYENGVWQGDIIEYLFDTEGDRITDASVGTNPPVAGLTNWTARATFVTEEAANNHYWKTGRKIIMHNGSQQSAFLWSNLSTTEQGYVDPITAAKPSKTNAYDSPILNFVRGDRSKEYPNGLLRTRYSLLGDIVGSNIVYLGAASGLYFGLPGYATYFNNNTNRDGRLYVGANDGLVHVFDVDDGREVYAYAPSMVFRKLSNLTEIPYFHTYYADGPLNAADAQVSGAWTTVLAGGLGAGGKGLFALDIGSPDLSSETENTGSNRKILWEKDGSDSNMGHVYGEPKIARLPDDQWYVVSGNGYGSTSGVASLMLVNISTGVISNISAGIGGANGLSAPTLIDSDGDLAADYAYAGDLLGNLWKFDLKSRSVRKLFAAGTDKPITNALAVGLHPNGGHIMFFGTGSLLSELDAGNLDQQTFYGIWDKPGSTSTVADNSLQSQTLTLGEHPDGDTVRVATSNAVNWLTQFGWKTDFPVLGERLLGQAQLRGGRLQFVSIDTNRNNWLMGLDWMTGGDSESILFDLNENGELDDPDKLTIAGNAYYPVAIGLGISNFSQPTIARVTGGIDAMYLNGLTMPSAAAPTGCTGSCVGGIEDGHVDVDTDTQLGGSTEAHEHEYDDKYDITYMDFLDLLGGKLQSADENPPDIDPDLKLVAILANADFSQGGNLTIRNKTWTVLDYQQMVQSALENWDGVDLATLLDDDGDPLAFSLNDIVNENYLRITFNSKTIQQGGLIPTQTSCVKDTLMVTNGRWRNGALTIQLLEARDLKAGGDSDNVYLAQNPTDLTPGVVGGGLTGNPSNTNGFVWEATMFWHFKDWSRKCYGENGWEEDRIEAQAAALTMTTNLSGEQLQLQLYQIQSLLDSYVCKKTKKNKCKDKDYKDLIKEYNLIEGLLESFPGSSETVTVPVLPADVTDTSETFFPSPGTTGPIGRASWVEISGE